MYTPFQSNLMEVGAGAYSSTDGNGVVTTTPLTGVGLRYFVSDNWVASVGVNVGVRNWKNTTNTDYTSTTVGIDANMDYSLRTIYNISPYIGVNVNYGMMNTNGGGTNLRGEAYGLGANLGFDWYFTPGISLGGKYTLGFQVATNPAQNSNKVYSLGTGLSSVVMNVHF